MKFKHGYCVGGKYARTYDIWREMRKRCSNPNRERWHRYGGRGITVCKEWDDYRVFLSDMGEAPPGLTLERCDNNGSYCKANCRWATRHDQNRNTSINAMLTFRGKTQCRTDWERELGLSSGAIWHRLKNGWSLDKTLSTRKMT